MVGKGRRDAIATLLMLLAAPAAYGLQIAGMSNTCPHCRHSFAASTTALRSHVPLIMLAKKPFKGGRLDDFLSAGEAEAKYGPGRYAAVSEDMWKVKLKEEGINAARERTKQEFKALEFQLLQDHAFLSILGCLAFWSTMDIKSALSCGVGAAFGAFYLYLLQRSVEGVGATTAEEVSKTPPAIVAPVLLVLIVGKNLATLSLIPALVGFALNQVATLYQIAYPEGWGLPKDDQAAA